MRRAPPARRIAAVASPARPSPEAPVPSRGVRVPPAFGHSLARLSVSQPVPAAAVSAGAPLQLRRRGRAAARRRARRRRQRRLRAAKGRFLGLPQERAWREIVDARHHELGENVYDEGLHRPENWAEEGYESEEAARQDFAEPGYLESAMRARAFVAGRIGKRVDADFLEQVHALASRHKEESEDYHRGYRTRADKESHASFDAPEDYQVGQPAAAVRELDPRFTVAHSDDGFTENLADLPAGTGNETSLLLHFPAKRPRALKAEVNNILGHYYRRIGRQRTQGQKLRLIARTHRRLENLHPFLDANTRTNRLILHKLLVENGMSPVVLENPLQVHLHSDEEWAGVLAQGMERWGQTRQAL